MKVVDHRPLRMMLVKFSKKNFWENLGQKRAQNEVFWTFLEDVSLFFSDFWFEIGRP